MSPSQVIDAHVDLTACLAEHRVASAILMPITRTIAETKGRDVDDPKVRAVSDDYQQVALAATRTAYCYRVTADMCDLVAHAADSLDEEDTWDPSLAPTGAGLVRFERPFVVESSERGDVHAGWLMWGPGRNGRTVLIWFGNAAEVPQARWSVDAPDEALAWYQRATRGWSMFGWTQAPTGASLGPSRLASDTDGVRRTEISDTRTTHALWLLLGQTITTVVDEVPDRASRRRAGRVNLPQRVTCVDLRRSASAVGQSEGESQVQWSHRWVVRGHWRWQACGVGRAERRRIWVNPFVKGPEGAPLVQSDKVYNFRR